MQTIEVRRVESKIMALCFATFLLVVVFTGNAAVKVNEALTMVPKSELFEKVGREVILKTPAGSKVLLEYDRAGNFEEASGLNLNRGDEFEPGRGLISLSTAAQSVISAGKVAAGKWNLERDKKQGWLYEIQVQENGEIKELYVDAKTGKLIK